jgi:sRNA-binding protein
VSHALRLYTSSAAYLRCLRPWADRVDLTGNRVGVVTVAEAARAAERLATRLLKSANGKGARKAATISAAPRPLPGVSKRLSLRDLKAAWQQRRLNRERATPVVSDDD